MAVRYFLAGLAPERVRITPSPHWEALFSLRVMLRPQHHALQHDWGRRLYDLPRDLRREMRAFAYAFEWYQSGARVHVEGRALTFEEEMARVRAMDLAEVRADFLRPLLRDLLFEESPVPIEIVRDAARKLPAASCELALLALEDPAALLARYTSMLEQYWEEAFAAEWDRIQPQLEQAAHDMRAVLGAEGLLPLLAHYWRRFTVDWSTQAIWTEAPEEFEYRPADSDVLVLIVSLYAWPDVMWQLDPDLPMALCLPVQMFRRVDDWKDPGDLPVVLRGVADPVRLRILHLLAQRPRTTEELAPLTFISPSAVSRHLKILADAGVVTRRREGYYVLYRLVPDRLQYLFDQLESFLGPSLGTERR